MIIRGPRLEKHFTILDNAVIRDGRLSFRARGVLAYILSQPDGWRSTSEDLARVATEGREAVRTAMRELEAAGYVERRKEQNQSGQWVTHVTVYDRPRPEDGFPGLGLPDAGFLGAIQKNQRKDYLPSAKAPAQATDSQVHNDQSKGNPPKVPAEVMAELKLALIEVCEMRAAEVTQWGPILKAAKAIALVGGTPREVRRRARAYQAEWPNATLTPSALARHWAKFAPAPDVSKSANLDAAVACARQWFREGDLPDDVVRRLTSTGMTHPDEIAAGLKAVGLSEDVVG